MSDGPLRLPDGIWDEPGPPLRRDFRVGPPPLPVAAPVVHAASAERAVPAARLVIGLAAVAAIGVSATIVTLVSSETPVDNDYIAATHDLTTSSLVGEGGGPGSIGPLQDRDAADPDSESDAPPADGDRHPDDDVRTDGDGRDDTDEDRTDNRDDSNNNRNDNRDDDSNNDDSNRDDGEPKNPPVRWEPPNQPPPPPPPPPNPPQNPPPPQDPPPPPVAPDPLAFVGLQATHTVNLLGITMLSSYTLTVSGEPGSTASVTYGSRTAGSVTFDRDGRASLEVGGSLLGLVNPVVRVAYTDGTPGEPIEARRDAI